MSRQSDEYRTTLNQSAQFLSQNRPGDALRVLEPLIEAEPTDPDVAINAGGAYILQRKWDKAVKAMSAAADANPDNTMLWSNLAAAQLGSLETSGPKQQDRAIESYQHVLKIDPIAPNIHYSLGLIYKERGELLRASVFFHRAIEVNPADNDAAQWIERIEAILAEEQRQRMQEKLAGKQADETSSDSQTAD
jgi:tetratricopeptide (TPR) repeat protein